MQRHPISCRVIIPGPRCRSSMAWMTPNGVGSGARLVLASASPRRRALLESVGVVPVCVDVDIDESPLVGELPAALVARLAQAKARAGLAVSGMTGHDVVVIGADTTVALGEESLAKPDDDDHARSMLRRLSGRRHRVLTGVAVAFGGTVASAVDASTVTFRQLSEAEIEAYVASGEPRGKAGAYAIQGRGGLFVPRIEGSYHSIVGLPLAVLDDLCRTVAGRTLASWATPPPGEGVG